jgi:multiple sugar transport system permease protein
MEPAYDASRKWRHRKRIRVAPALFLAPAVVLFVTFVIWPIVSTIAISLTDWDGVGARHFLGFDNYRELAVDPLFRRALLNNALWLACFALAPILGLALAILLNRTTHSASFYRAMFFFPFVVSQVVIGLIFAWFLNVEFGLIAELARAFGFAPVAILEDGRFAIFGVILAALWPQTAYCMLLYLAGLSALRPDLIGAARIDGAHGFRLFWNVVRPQLTPATTIAVVVSAVGALRSFDLVAIMTNGGPYGSSMVLALYMYEQTFHASRFGYGAAIATVLLILMTFCVATIFVVGGRRA